MTPKLTVLMTVYNGEAYLKECIDSVLNQTYNNFEFLIIDDCSTDRSRDLIKSYKDDRIQLIENEKNLNQVRSLNIGLECALGRYVARMDQDDIMVKDRLKRQIDFLDKNHEVSVVGTWGEAIDKEGRVFVRSCFPTRNEEIIGNVLFGGYFLMHSSVIFKRDPVIDVGKYNEAFSFAEDYDLWTRLLLKGYKLANIPEFLTKLRCHKKSSSKQFLKVQVKNAHASMLNFIKIINGNLSNSDLDRLYNILINAEQMKKEYWLNEMNIIHLDRAIGLLESLLEKTISYFNLKKSEIYLMKKVFCNRMLNFAYQASGKGKRRSFPLFLFCLKNYPFLYRKPKLYLYPIKSIL